MRFMLEQRDSSAQPNFGLAWFLLCLAFAAHVTDEALTGFLGVYNPTVLAVRAQLPWFPMPTFEYRQWLIVLIVANLICLLLTPFAFRNAQWLRPLACLRAHGCLGSLPPARAGLLLLAAAARRIDFSFPPSPRDGQRVANQQLTIGRREEEIKTGKGWSKIPLPLAVLPFYRRRCAFFARRGEASATRKVRA